VNLEKKYRHAGIKYYIRKLHAEIEGIPFSEVKPAKNFEEKYTRIVNSV
jgi:hypothetical protein